MAKFSLQMTLILCGSAGVFAAHARADVDSDACVSAHAESQVLRNRGSFVRAHDELMICARSTCPKPIADDCASWLVALEDSLSSVVFAVSDETGRDLADVTVTANGARIAYKTDGHALLMDPGMYTLRFSAEGFASEELPVAIRQSEKNRIVRVSLRRKSSQLALESSETVPEVPLADDNAEPAIPVATYVLGATTLVGAGMFAYFGLTGLAKEHDLAELPPQASCGSLCAEGKRAYILADIGLGVAVASAAGAVITFLLHDPRPDHAPTSSARVGIAPLAAQRGLLVHYRAAF